MVRLSLLRAGLVLACWAGAWPPRSGADETVVNVPPTGYRALFNGQDLAGWQGMGTENPYQLAAKTAEERAAFFAGNQPGIDTHWQVVEGVLVNDGQGPYLTTLDDFGDIELWVDYKTVPKADSGIYLRATPQVQIWDSTETEKFRLGADKGSGGLWNNSPGAPGKDPLVLADKPFGEWNRFRIVQVGRPHHRLAQRHARRGQRDHGELLGQEEAAVARGPIQLQTHGGEIAWKNVFVREIGGDEANRWLHDHAGDGFAPAFNGRDLSGWAGATDNYEVVDGAIRCQAGKGARCTRRRNTATSWPGSSFACRRGQQRPGDPLPRHRRRGLRRDVRTAGARLRGSEIRHARRPAISWLGVWDGGR